MYVQASNAENNDSLILERTIPAARIRAGKICCLLTFMRRASLTPYGVRPKKLMKVDGVFIFESLHPQAPI